ncbi:MAG TPA: molybdopterin molybdotransferase MoeA [Tepidisphaeraceae bacterium]|nr:molybdopterin molybdotransferase MoeA [Tepidisphaeraceae bacterium]
MSEPDVSDLLTVAQAIAVIDAAAVTPRIEVVPLSQAAGLVLAEDVVADRDYPPFDKSLMDGYAVRCADVSSAPVELALVGEIPAGQRADRGLAEGETLAIMTGAPLPPGADGVVPVEDSERTTAQRVRLLSATTPGRYIARRGSEVLRGAVVLTRGTVLGPAQLAVAASVGAARLPAFAKPRTGVLATGDELVPADQPPDHPPGPAQIRNSNSVMLLALLERLGCAVTDLGTVRDDPAAVRAALLDGIDRCDVLFVTGGMSMGAYDYVPRTLLDLGVDLRITKLRIKPGKPFVFGEHRHEGTESLRRQGRDEAAGASEITDASSHTPRSVPSCLRASVPSSCYLFGLPGNPVSGYVCTMRLAARLIARLRGADAEPRWLAGRLAEPLPANGPREFYQPVVVAADGSITPLLWKGSADVFTLARATALLPRPENEPALPAGAPVRVLEVPS